MAGGEAPASSLRGRHLMARPCGAQYVIAFRCRVVGGDGVAMARDFYRRWAAAGLALDASSELRQHAWDDDGFFTSSLLEDRPMG